MDNRNTPHELDEMFPQARDVLHALKTGNAHFARLADEYHTINRAIHRMETHVEPVSDETMETERKKRLRLLDEIAAMIDKHRQG
ncbi:MAG: YdcH family protein [Beijerinckiaceae bacterium]